MCARRALGRGGGGTVLVAFFVRTLPARPRFTSAMSLCASADSHSLLSSCPNARTPCGEAPAGSAGGRATAGGQVDLLAECTVGTWVGATVGREGGDHGPLPHRRVVLHEWLCMSGSTCT